MIARLIPALLVMIAFLACLQPVFCDTSANERWITYESPDGEELYLKDNRRPSLYTANYGDCLGNSLVNVTRFDAAYYKDNMTVLFHLAGNTALHNESVVMYIGVFAYGESRFDLTFNPCHANIASLCPLNSSVPVSASGIIPVAEQDVSSIPSLALSIPDFEGQAILRIFANSTQSEIGCYSAVITNGHSFAQPKSVGSVLGIFTVVAMIASFATAIYGEAVPTMRLHYAHSPSVGVVIAVFQHIFFTGALSMNWPAVLVAWWHNFAWSGGMIHNTNMQNNINRLIGNVIGNTTQVGAAPSNSGDNNVGGGYEVSQIYKRVLAPSVGISHPIARDLASEIYKSDYPFELHRRELFLRKHWQHHVERALQARDYLANKSDGYRWYGHPIGAGMPLPGNYSGFSGTLAEENIRISNAFMTGFSWFLILLGLVVGAVAAFKWLLEGLIKLKCINRDRLEFFRLHWIGYTIVVALRACYLGFFLLMFLTIFEFSIQSSAGVKIVAALVLLTLIICIPGAAASACFYKMHFTNSDPNQPIEHTNLLGVIPWISPTASTRRTDNETTLEEPPGGKIASKPFWKRKISASNQPDEQNVVNNIHDNVDYTLKFGWLASRFRRTRWWFFIVWLIYDFLRAVFYAGASGHPLTQVFGLLVVESLAFAYIIWARPFEGRRLNILVVYCLGFSKVASVALSAAFDVQFNLPRITTTMIGIVIIAIQGILTIVTLIAIVGGTISSYMSVSRHLEDFRPRKWHGLREKYFDHLDRVVNDLPRTPKAERAHKRRSADRSEQKTGFEVKSMKRMAKIEDEDTEFASEMRTQDSNISYLDISDEVPTPVNSSDTVIGTQRSWTATPAARSRASSMQSLSPTNLPSGARPYKPSWSAREINDSWPLRDDRTQDRLMLLEGNLAGDETETSLFVRQANLIGTSSPPEMRESESAFLPFASTEMAHLGSGLSAKVTAPLEEEGKMFR